MAKLAFSLLAVFLLVCYIRKQSTAAIVTNKNNNEVIIRDNVVYYKTGEVFTTRAKWLATLVLDFQYFEYFMSKIEEDINMARSLLIMSDKKYTKHNEDFEAFRNTLTFYMQLAKMNIQHIIDHM